MLIKGKQAAMIPFASAAAEYHALMLSILLSKIGIFVGGDTSCHW